MNENPILRVSTKILFAPIILFGLYVQFHGDFGPCLLYTSPSPRDLDLSRMPSSA